MDDVTFLDNEYACPLQHFREGVMHVPAAARGQPANCQSPPSLCRFIRSCPLRCQTLVQTTNKSVIPLQSGS